MATEIEIKLRLADAAALRERLEACGARRAGQVREVNSIFDRPDGSLQRADCALRIRRVAPLGAVESSPSPSPGGAPESAWLTFKGPRTGSSPQTREELEVRVQDADALVAILARLGLLERVVYEKRREAWRLEGCEVALDELPGLGRFVEIEGPDEQAVRNLRTRLGLEQAERVNETYVELADRHGHARSDGVRELRFGSSGPAPVRRG